MSVEYLGLHFPGISRYTVYPQLLIYTSLVDSCQHGLSTGEGARYVHQSSAAVGVTPDGDWEVRGS